MKQIDKIKELEEDNNKIKKDLDDLEYDYNELKEEYENVKSMQDEDEKNAWDDGYNNGYADGYKDCKKDYNILKEEPSIDDIYKKICKILNVTDLYNKKEVEEKINKLLSKNTYLK